MSEVPEWFVKALEGILCRELSRSSLPQFRGFSQVCRELGYDLPRTSRGSSMNGPRSARSDTSALDAGGLLSTSRSIGEAHASAALQCALGTDHVIGAETLAVVISKVELGEVAMQMLLPAVLVDAEHPTLEDGEDTFDGVGVDIAPNIFVLPVLNSIVAVELGSDVPVKAALIGQEQALAVDVVAHERHDVGDGGTLDMEGADLSAALDKVENRPLVPIAALGLLPTLLQADVGLIDLDLNASAAHGLKMAAPHGLTDAMREEPSRLDGDAQHTGKLMAADALLARAEKLDRLQPQMQLKVGGLENGADAHGEGLAARIALVEAGAGGLTRELADPLSPFAVRADRPARPQMRFDKRESGVLIMEMIGGEDGLRHGLLLDAKPTSKGWVCQV